MRYLILFFLLVFSPFAPAQQLNLPIVLNYPMLEAVLSSQLASTGDTYTDAQNCNTLTLSAPRVAGAAEGQIRLLTGFETKIAAPLGEKCRLPVNWSGMLETYETVMVSPDGRSVTFSITRSNILNREGKRSWVPKSLWGLVTKYAHPQLQSLKVDLDPVLDDLQALLVDVLAAPSPEVENSLYSLRITGISANQEALRLDVQLTVPDLEGLALPEAPAPLDTTEIAAWDRSWQSWDGFATWLIKNLAVDAGPELQAALAEILLMARYELRDALVINDRSRDPVRELFVKTWQRLTPLLQDLSGNMTGSRALKFVSLISAGDALLALDSAVPYLGITLDTPTFRSLARLLLPGVSENDLSYSTEVDASLRALLGLEPDFQEESQTAGPFAWLIPAALAADVDQRLVKKLTGWVPKADELDEYLAAVNQILDEIARAERDKGKVPGRFFPVYESLFLATAWQESCWRQFIGKGGSVKPIISSAGSVGLMQVNQHVWRGVYDPAALHSNIAYNARAGNEILVHYLVDFAVKKGEYEITGHKDSLARAAYAAYNGGPNHLTRYRDPNSKASLKKIDAAFWKKYQAINQHGTEPVKSCYTG